MTLLVGPQLKYAHVCIILYYAISSYQVRAYVVHTYRYVHMYVCMYHIANIN